MKRTVAVFLAGIVCIVGGAFLAKYVDAASGALLATTGGGLVMWLKEKPKFAQRHLGENEGE